MVEPYHEFAGDSGIWGFELGDDFLDVYFDSGVRYRYSNASCGSMDCERMKQLAVQGAGLNTFINQVRPPYESKVP